MEVLLQLYQEIFTTSIKRCDAAYNAKNGTTDAGRDTHIVSTAGVLILGIHQHHQREP